MLLAGRLLEEACIMFTHAIKCLSVLIGVTKIYIGLFFQPTLDFIRVLLDENCTDSSFVQFPFSHSLTTPVSS
jgi:hypothetical protein